MTIESIQIIEALRFGLKSFNEMDSFSGEINTLFNDGWKLDSINGESNSWWIFKRPIEEEE